MRFSTHFSPKANVSDIFEELEEEVLSDKSYENWLEETKAILSTTKGPFWLGKTRV